MAKSPASTDVNERPFKASGAFLRKKRKAAGYKTQKAYIQALKKKAPGISCSEPYISLIEKGVKIPALKLFNVMAEVLALTPTEKGELLLSYKRVPRDFEFAVRDNLKAAARPTHTDQLRETYQQSPSQESYRELLTALVLQQRTEEALQLLKEAPTFEDEVQELQLRTAQIASLSGNRDFAESAFALALQEAASETLRIDILRYLGIHFFQQGLLVQEAQPVAALECYLEALSHFSFCLEARPLDTYILDESARCCYNVADVIFHLERQQQLKKPAKTRFPHWWATYQQAFGEGKNAETVQACVRDYFDRARTYYAQVLSLADQHPLPEKAMQEAVFFYGYVQGKLGHFQGARIFLHSVIALKPNWLILFMKAGLSIMEYEHTPNEALLDQALDYLQQAHEQNGAALRQLIQDEQPRELSTLWQQRPQEMEKLSHAR